MKQFSAIIILAAVIFITVKPLFSPGYFPMHDDTQVARVIAMGKAIQNGQIPVRWVDGLGYGLGYPIFNFYGPLPYYFGGFLYALGADGLAATKLMMGTGMILGAVSMFFLLSRYGWSAALTGASLYVLAPYHAVQLFVRGSVGELWAYGFLPLLFFAGNSRLRFAGIAGLAGIILSHTIYGYIAAGCMGAVTVIIFLLSRRYQTLLPYPRNLAAVLVAGVTLTAFFWLPAFSEMKYTQVAGMSWDPAKIEDHFVCAGQLWSSVWGYGGSAPGCLDGMSFMIGKLHIILSVAAVVLILGSQRDSPRIRTGIVPVIILTLLSVLMMLPQSLFIWKLIPYAEYIQYPWRLLMTATFGTSVLGAYIIGSVRMRPLRVLTAVIIIATAVLIYSKRFVPQYTYPYDQRRTDASEITFRASGISDEYLPPEVLKPASPDQVPREPVTAIAARRVEYEKVTETYIKAFVTAGDNGGAVRINRAFFPGWIYLVNGKKTQPQITGGLPEIAVSQGLNVLEAVFTDTTIRRISNIISLLSLLVLIAKYGKKAVR